MNKHHPSEESKKLRKYSSVKKHIEPVTQKSSEQPHRPCARPEAAINAPVPEPAAAEKETAKEKRLNDQLIRLHADFDNFRKRVIRDKKELFESTNQDIMMELLSVLDHFELALQATIKHNADKQFREGLEMIHNQLMGVLTKFGLCPIDAEKRQFDPMLFEAVNYIASDKEPEGMVIAQTRRGYLLHNKLLRPAQVIVSSGKKHTSDNIPEKPIESVKE